MVEPREGISNWLNLVNDRQVDVDVKVTAEECKDSEGNWTKWIIERLDPIQLGLYKEMRQQISSSADAGDLMPLDDYSENTIIRFLQGNQFNIEKSLEAMVQAEQYFAAKKPWEFN